MDEETVQRLIQEKLADGRLPHDSIPRISAWRQSSPADAVSRLVLLSVDCGAGEGV